jgi:hypothetical protein
LVIAIGDVIGRCPILMMSPFQGLSILTIF